MTNLEQTLAELVQAIEKARASGQPRALAALLRRKQAICAALAAPEHAWHAAPVAPATDQRACEGREPALVPALADPCV